MNEKQPTRAPDLTDAALIARAKSLANRWIFAISLQHDRVTSPRPQDKVFHPFGADYFHEADVHFLAIALQRLRKIAKSLEYVPQLRDRARSAGRTFDESLPWVKRVRDVFEHLEDYAVDSNRRHTKTTLRQDLQVWSADSSGMKWLGCDIDWSKTLAVAQELHTMITSASDGIVVQAKNSDKHTP